MKRLICLAVGCSLHNDYPACHRCGGALYYDFIDEGRLEPVLSFWRRLKAELRIKRCHECGKRMPWRSKEYCCSDRCYDTWVPF